MLPSPPSSSAQLRANSVPSADLVGEEGEGREHVEHAREKEHRLHLRVSGVAADSQRGDAQYRRDAAFDAVRH